MADLPTNFFQDLPQGESRIEQSRGMVEGPKSSLVDMLRLHARIAHEDGNCFVANGVADGPNSSEFDQIIEETIPKLSAHRIVGRPQYQKSRFTATYRVHIGWSIIVTFFSLCKATHRTAHQVAVPQPLKFDLHANRE